MSHGRLTRVVVLALVLVVAFTLPIAGCKKSGGGAVVIEVGQDPSTGNEFGTWGGWNSVPLAGQRYKYSIVAYSNASATYPLSPPAWLELTFTDAGGGALKVTYAGSDSVEDFSGEDVYIPQEKEWVNSWADSTLTEADDLGVDVEAARDAPQQMLMALIAPAFSLDTRGSPDATRHTWTVGESWFQTGSGRVQIFAITGKRAFAGVTGAFGEFLADSGGGQELTEFCVNPNVALPLYVKQTSRMQVNFEYVLTEYSGPARSGEGTAGATGSPGTTSGSAAGPGAEVGQDPSTGNELGQWGDWNPNPAVGQRFEYAIGVSGGRPQPQSSVVFTFSDAEGLGGAEVKVTYAGNAFGRDFSGEDPLWFDWGSWAWCIADPAAESTLAGLLAPASYLGANPSVDVGQHTWAAGQNWSYTDLGGTVTFEITGKKAFGGITGAWGEYTEAYGHIPALVTEFCVNPNVPLPLYVRTTFGKQVLFECALTQYLSRQVAEGPSPPSSSSAATWNGIWDQKDDNGIQGYFAWLFEDGYVYLGLKGDSRDEIYDDVYVIRGASESDKKGIPFRIEATAIVLSMPDGKEMSWKRDGTTFWFGTGEIKMESPSGVQGPNLVTVSLDGEYVPR